MNIPIVVNVILLILIVHLLIQYIPKLLNWNSENFENIEINEIQHQNNNDSDILKELMNEENDTAELEKYLNSNDINIQDLPQPSDEYISNVNTPNFENNITDYRKFYNINQAGKTELPNANYYTIDWNNKQPSTVDPISAMEQQVQQDIMIQNESNTSNEWQYKDDMPMNGGSMNGVVGVSIMDNMYANNDNYGCTVPLCPVDNMNCDGMPDDLRMGMGTPGRTKIAMNV